MELTNIYNRFDDTVIIARGARKLPDGSLENFYDHSLIKIVEKNRGKKPIGKSKIRLGKIYFNRGILGIVDALTHERRLKLSMWWRGADFVYMKGGALVTSYDFFNRVEI